MESRFGKRMARETGALELMSDLGEALALSATQPVQMLGGGNPARIPAVEAVYRRRLAEIAASEPEFGRFAASYSSPGGDAGFRAAVAEMLEREYGWPLTLHNIALTAGSQTAFFALFNLLAGERAGKATARILLPLAPEYIGYADLGLTDDMLVSRRAQIEDCGNGYFKYRPDFAALDGIDSVAAVCVSRPTNPTGNVLTLEELQKLAALAQSRRVPLIIDAAYGMPFPGIQYAHHQLTWDENTILCLSLSKLGLPATRTGIVVASEDMIEAVTAFTATAALAPASTGPVIVEPLLRSGELRELCYTTIRPYYEDRCAEAVAELHRSFGTTPLRIHQPEGAFFLWLWFPDLPITSHQLYLRLKKRGVFVLSGHHFFPGLEESWPHARQCVRINYSQARESVRAGIQVIADEVRRAFQEG
jgi:valine--pyruvate aminotransferase